MLSSTMASPEPRLALGTVDLSDRWRRGTVAHSDRQLQFYSQRQAKGRIQI